MLCTTPVSVSAVPIEARLAEIIQANRFANRACKLFCKIAEPSTAVDATPEATSSVVFTEATPIAAGEPASETPDPEDASSSESLLANGALSIAGFNQHFAPLVTLGAAGLGVLLAL